MESIHKILPPEQLMPQLPELLKEATAIPLVISGNSMVPFLVHGRDTVFLSKLPHSPVRGDMILYRRDCVAYVLHRIFKTENGLYTMLGDAHTTLEPGIRAEQCIAIVTAVRRKGKILQKGNFLWWFFETPWLRLRPFRPHLLRLYALLKR